MELREDVRAIMTDDEPVDRKQAVKSMTDEQLAHAAEFWRAHVTSIPDDGSPVYETTLIHVLVPEMIDRLSPDCVIDFDGYCSSHGNQPCHVMKNPSFVGDVSQKWQKRIIDEGIAERENL